MNLDALRGMKEVDCAMSQALSDDKTPLDGVPKPAFLVIKWGDEFDARSVNILKRAAFENCSLDVRFVCLTDDGTGLDADIEVAPIPQFELYSETPRSGIWPKMSLFHPELTRILELVVFLDLDTIVVGSLDPFFEDPGDSLRLLSCGLRWRNMDASQPTEAATGVMTYNMSRQAGIFEAFQRDPVTATQNYILEQIFVGDMAEQVSFYPMPWIQSFKYHLRREYLVDLFRPPLPPAAETRLVAFHGFPRPVDVAKPGHKWARELRCGLHRPKWVSQYWSKYEGDVKD